MAEITKEMYKKYMAAMISRAWIDPAYREELEKNPNKVLQDSGIPVPDSVKINVIFNSSSEHNLVIPAPPEAKDITDADFVSAAAQVAAHEQLVLPTVLLRKRGK